MNRFNVPHHTFLSASKPLLLRFYDTTNIQNLDFTKSENRYIIIYNDVDSIKVQVVVCTYLWL